ncbi:MAG: 4Fe-4S dicluster domain-containing protein [Pseudomonadota bacterium]
MTPLAVGKSQRMAKNRAGSSRIDALSKSSYSTTPPVRSALKPRNLQTISPKIAPPFSSVTAYQPLEWLTRLHPSIRQLKLLKKNTKHCFYYKTYNTAGEFIQEAFAGLKDKLPLSGERKVAVTQALEAVIQKIGELPLARTEAFFYEQEHYQHETGELLSLVINPDACKACGLCIAACEPGALSAVPQTMPRIEQTRRLWRLWEQLPDTPGKSIERASGKTPLSALTEQAEEGLIDAARLHLAAI